MQNNLISERTKRLLATCVRNSQDKNEYLSASSNNEAENKQMVDLKEKVFCDFDSQNNYIPVVRNETGTSLNDYVHTYDTSVYEVLFEEEKTYTVLTNVNANVQREVVDSDDSIKDPDFDPTREAEDSESDGENKKTEVEDTNPNKVKELVKPIYRRIVKKVGKRANRQISRNTGKEYTTNKGKPMKARQPQPLKEKCRRSCKEKISDEIRIALFKSYWEMGNYDRRVSYIASLIQISDKMTTTNLRDTSKREKNREKTFKYFIEVEGERIQCCKECFRAIFNESNKFIQIVTNKKMLSDCGIPSSDGRGKHEPKNKISELVMQRVYNHISKFPAYESHYSRRHTDKKYLVADLTKTKMYELYTQDVSDNTVSFKVYSQAIDTMGLKFKKPSNDTCKTCDILKNKIGASQDENTKKYHDQLLQEHHAESEHAYESKRMDKLRCLDSKTEKILVFDLQQVLPTPFLTTGTVFYKRQLHTYNLTINDCSAKESTHFMWHEAIAGRGANEIASCLFTFLCSFPAEIQHVTLYSDTCGGQNKNSFVAAMFTYILQKCTNLQIIDHKFLVPGHTHMECDSDHAIIEKNKKHSPFPIHVPRDWYNLVRLAGKRSNTALKRKREDTNGSEKTQKNKFTVVEMAQNMFFDFESLLKGVLVKRKKTETKNAVCWRSMKWLRYNKEFGILYFKTSLQEYEPFQQINLKRQRKELNFGDNIILPNLYNETRQINTKKSEDLLELLELIDDSAKEFYLGILNTQHKSKNPTEFADTDPDIDNYHTDEEF